MENLEKVQADVKEILSKERYNHSVGVMKKCIELAKIYKVNENIAALVGITHDIAKEMSNEEKLDYVRKNDIKIDEIEKYNVGLLHAKIGADIAKKKYGFTEDMQNAIKYHTTANENMNLLAKIVFVADKVEENRIYSGVEELRELAKDNINMCILNILNYSIKEQIDKGKLIHPDSIFIRNKLLNKELLYL